MYIFIDRTDISDSLISDVPDLCSPLALPPSLLDMWKKLPLSLALQSKDRSINLSTTYKPVNLDTKSQGHYSHQTERCRSPLSHYFLQQGSNSDSTALDRKQDCAASLNICPSTYQAFASKTSAPIHHFWSSINPIPALSAYSQFQFPFPTHSSLVYPASAPSPLSILSPTKAPISVIQ